MEETEAVLASGAEALFEEILATHLQSCGQLAQLQSQLDSWCLQINEDKSELLSQLAELDGLNRNLEHAAAAVLNTPASSAVPRYIIRFSSPQVHETRMTVTLENLELFDLSNLTLRFHCGSHYLESDVLEKIEADQAESRVLEGRQKQQFQTDLPPLEAGLTYEVEVVAENLQVSNTLQHRA